MMDLAALQAKVEKSVVSVWKVDGDEMRHGIVIECKPRSTHILVSGHDGFYTKGTDLLLGLPGGKVVRPSAIDARNDILLILIRHEVQPAGLMAITFYQGKLTDCQEVFTYSDRSKDRVITRGRIVSFFVGGFNHSCSAHVYTRFGAPVINSDCQLLGLCVSFADEGKVSAQDISYIRERMD